MQDPFIDMMADKMFDKHCSGSGYLGQDSYYEGIVEPLRQTGKNITSKELEQKLEEAFGTKNKDKLTKQEMRVLLHKIID